VFVLDYPLRWVCNVPEERLDLRRGVRIICFVESPGFVVDMPKMNIGLQVLLCLVIPSFFVVVDEEFVVGMGRRDGASPEVSEREPLLHKA
jgi:hypothetical protein